MTVGLLFFLAMLAMMGGFLTTKDYKPISRSLFSFALVLLVIGGLMFAFEKGQDSTIVEAFKEGKVLACEQAGQHYRVSEEKGWRLHGGDHFIREDVIVRAANCQVTD